MPPKFESSFIPKGPVASSSATMSLSMGRSRPERSLLAFLASIVFTGSILLAAGVFGYKLYLNYSLERLASELERGRSALELDTVSELMSLNNRIISTGELIGSHVMLSPFFQFLEASTLKSVRFTAISYAMTDKGLELSLTGEARGYNSLALQAELFNKSKHFREPVFSDLILDERGNVDFSFRALIDPAFLSYKREVERFGPPPPRITAPAATSTATSTVSTSSPQAATTTSR